VAVRHHYSAQVKEKISAKVKEGHRRDGGRKDGGRKGGTYSARKKYLVSHQLCKFSHLKR
jgi:hypothetical protein